MDDGRENIDIVPSIVSEEFWVAFAIICASTPILMRITKKFSTTGMVLGTTVGATKGTTTNGSFPMRSQASQGRSSPEKMVLRPDQVGYTISVNPMQDEVTSFHSNAGSQEGILREDRFEISSQRMH